MNKRGNVWILAVVGVVAVFALALMFQSSNSATGYAMMKYPLPLTPQQREAAIRAVTQTTNLIPIFVVGNNARGEAVILVTHIAVFVQNLRLPYVNFDIDNIVLDTEVSLNDLLKNEMTIFTETIASRSTPQGQNERVLIVVASNKASNLANKIKEDLRSYRPEVTTVIKTKDKLTLDDFNGDGWGT